MSGHSKWKTIQHKKGAADAKRGKMFSKLAKELMVAAKASGSDPATNASLRNIIQKAKGINMPADNIDRAIKKGAGELEGASFEEVMYETYVHSVGIVIVALTDNRNRTNSELRFILSKANANFAAQGSVTRGFVRKGQIFVAADSTPEDKLMELVLEAGAEDMSQDGDQYEILTDPANFAPVMEALQKAGIPTQSGEVSLVPMSYTPVTAKSAAQSVMRLVAEVEDHDDVQAVYTNMDVAEDLLAELDKA